MEIYQVLVKKMKICLLINLCAFFLSAACYSDCKPDDLVEIASKFFYHGSSTDGINRLEPRLRYTPGEELDSPASIYASDLPAFAAAHSFPWSSDEGIDLYQDNCRELDDFLENY